MKIRIDYTPLHPEDEEDPRKEFLDQEMTNASRAAGDQEPARTERNEGFAGEGPARAAARPFS